MVSTLKPRIGTSTQRARASTVSATVRTRGSAWVKLRRDILKRDAGLCVPCRRVDRLTLASEVDHIRELADGGTDDPSNLQSICTECHKAKTLAHEKARRGQ